MAKGHFLIIIIIIHALHFAANDNNYVDIVVGVGCSYTIPRYVVIQCTTAHVLSCSVVLAANEMASKACAVITFNWNVIIIC